MHKQKKFLIFNASASDSFAVSKIHKYRSSKNILFRQKHSVVDAAEAVVVVVEN